MAPYAGSAPLLAFAHAPCINTSLSPVLTLLSRAESLPQLVCTQPSRLAQEENCRPTPRKTFSEIPGSELRAQPLVTSIQTTAPPSSHFVHSFQQPLFYLFALLPVAGSLSLATARPKLIYIVRPAILYLERWK